jgi:chaperonin cofactor prefoldin
MTNEIKSAIDGEITNDTENSINLLNSNFKTIESNFNSLRENLEKAIAKAKEDHIKQFN